MARENEKLITLGEASRQFGISRFKLSQLIESGKLTVLMSELDRRERLVRVSELESLAKARPIATKKSLLVAA